MTAIKDNVRRSKQDKLLEGTMLMLKDDKEKKDLINKLIYFSECLKTVPLSDDNVLKTITMCKDHLQRSHDIVQKSLPKANSEVKEIAEVMRRIEKQAANESNPTIVANLSQTCSEFSGGNSDSSRIDENEVANVLLSVNDNGSNFNKKCHALTLKMTKNALLLNFAT